MVQEQDRELFTKLISGVKSATQNVLIENDLDEAPLGLVLSTFGYLAASLIARFPERERRLVTEEFVRRIYSTVLE